MAYHRYPANSYQWNTFANTREIDTADSVACYHVSHFLWDVAQSLGTSYVDNQGLPTGNGGTYYSHYIPALESFGYSCTELILENESYLTTSVLYEEMSVAPAPILMRGNSSNHTNGHAWVVDSIIHQTKWTYQPEYDSQDNQWKLYRYQLYGDFFHCNWGWYGTDNGWYLVFRKIDNSKSFNYDRKAILIHP